MRQNRLEILSTFKGAVKSYKGTIARCKCKCGNEKDIPLYQVTSGRTLSCGCLRLSTINENRKGQIKFIPEDELIRLYNEEKWSTPKLAKKYHVTARTIANRLKSLASYCGNRISKEYSHISKTYWNQIINGASTRELSFDITYEQAYQKLITQNFKCALSGLEIKLSRNIKKEEQTASLDRIDSSRGYELNNIQWLHKDINKIKQDFNESDFIKYIKLIYNNLGLTQD